MPVNRKRQKRDYTGGIPEWFVEYLKTGRPPAKNSFEFNEYCAFELLAGTKVAGFTWQDADTAAKRKICRQKLGI